MKQSQTNHFRKNTLVPALQKSDNHWLWVILAILCPPLLIAVIAFVVADAAQEVK